MTCKGCSKESAEAWCEVCTKDVMVKLVRSFEERKAETFRERMERKERFLKARVQRVVQ